MRIVHVTNHRDVTRLSAAVTVLALAFVTLITLLLYPRAYWPREFMVAWPTTTLLAYGVTRLVGRQMLRIHALNERLQALVRRDRLTDVGTRDFFFDCLAERPNSHGVCLMVDIDRFKQVNDTHGHLTGDTVIAHVARILAESVGARDIVCRFGGEEFLVFLENATASIALELSERIRGRIEVTPVEGDGASVSVTVSIGGSLRQPAAEIEAAIGQADAALYRAKTMGRNRVVMACDPLTEAELLRVEPARPEPRPARRA